MIEHFFGLLVTQTWQIAALTIVVAVVVKLAAKNRPQLAHALWVLLLIKCVTPPLWGHSLGVFSQLQAWIIPVESASQPDVSGSPASVPVAMAETVIAAPVLNMFDPEHVHIETCEADELLPLADTTPPEDASPNWGGGTGIEFDETAQTPSRQEANIAYAEPALPGESVKSDAGRLRPGWWLLSGLAVGASLTLFIMVIRCLRCLRLIHRHRTTEFDELLRERVRHLSRQLRIRRIPQIIVSDVLFGPAVLGLLRHTIVLPRCLFETAEGSDGRSFLPERTFAERRTALGSTSAQRQSLVIDLISSGRVAASREVLPGREDLQFLDPILAHELLHIRRGDLRTGTLQAIVQCLWWFHPFVWLSNRWLSREAERCCDEQVIAELGCSPAQYARSLLSVIECKHRLQPIPVFPGMKPVEITTQRMVRIMSLKNGLRKRTPLWCWVVVVIFGFIVLPGAIAQRSSDESLSSQAAALSGLTITNDRETEAVLEVLAPGLATEQAIAHKGVHNDPKLVGPVRFDQQSNAADDENKATTPEVQDPVSGRYEGPPTPERIRKLRLDSDDKLPVPVRPMPPAIQQSSDPLVKLVWEARESSRRRLLTTDQHTPWQLMHGLLGLRQDFVVNHNGRIINGLEWIQGGPTFKDEPPFQEDQPWFQKTKHGGRAHPYLRPYLFEGHINQFAAILASCRLPLYAQFGTPDGPITMTDLITNAQMTANEKEEVSWTLSALSRYLTPDAKWVNAKGEEWSIERLVKVEVGKTIGGSHSPCGGTCGLFALAIARKEYLRSGRPLVGVWLEADHKIQKCIELARTQQNADGTLSSNYFKGGEAQKDFDKRLASSGALLQFLMMAASDEQLKEDWLRRAVEATVNDLMTNRKEFISAGPLFETTNAFGIYLDRISVSAVADVKPDAKEVSLADRLILVSYPVADLVFRHQSVVVAVSRSSDSDVDAPVVPATALTSGAAAAPDQIVDVPDAGRQAKALTYKADLTPLVELIKASVQPDSWHERGTIAVEEETLSLVIRQSPVAHHEISELLSQLRDAQDQRVQIPCMMVRLTKESQTKWLEEQCSLNSLEHGSRWALLPQQRCEAFTQALLEQKPEVFSRPRVITISDQTATITVGQSAVGGTPTIGIRLEVTPHVLPYSNVIRLQHSFSIGDFANEMPQPIESLVGSGQTLLLLVDDPEDKEKPDAARSQYLLLMTPEHIPQKEEDEDVSDATPDDSASAVESAESTDK